MYTNTKLILGSLQYLSTRSTVFSENTGGFASRLLATCLISYTRRCLPQCSARRQAATWCSGPPVAAARTLQRRRRVGDEFDDGEDDWAALAYDLSWEYRMSACRPDPPKDRHLLSAPTCHRHVSQHVGNIVPKCVATGADMTRQLCRLLTCRHHVGKCRQQN